MAITQRSKDSPIPKSSRSAKSPKPRRDTGLLFAEWKPVGCCETPAGATGPTVTITPHITSKGLSLGVIFTASHPCGLQNFNVTVTVYDTAGSAWTQTITEVFVCGSTGNETLYRARWLWAVAMIAKKEPPSQYMGPLPDRIASAIISAEVQSCCGKVTEDSKQISVF